MISFWDSFFFSLETPFAAALFRIAIGAIFLLQGFSAYELGGKYYGVDGVLGQQLKKVLHFTSAFNLYRYFGGKEPWLRLVNGLYLVACFALVVGFLTELSAAYCFLVLYSRNATNPYLEHGYSMIGRILMFFLIFAGAGKILSVDHFLFYQHHPELIPHVMWPLRLMQLQISLLYFQTALHKLYTPAWVDGSAVGLNALVSNYARIPFHIPLAFRYKFVSVMATWATLAIEFGLALGVWFEPTRIPVLVIGTLLHLGIMLNLKVYYFSPMMIASYLLFLLPHEVSTVAKNLLHDLAKWG
jgi:uncharacterized membrane protein YphA (DoxX/SURF4 family)